MLQHYSTNLLPLFNHYGKQLWKQNRIKCCNYETITSGRNSSSHLFKKQINVRFVGAIFLFQKKKITLLKFKTSSVASHNGFSILIYKTCEVQNMHNRQMTHIMISLKKRQNLSVITLASKRWIFHSLGLSIAMAFFYLISPFWLCVLKRSSHFWTVPCRHFWQTGGTAVWNLCWAPHSP